MTARRAARYERKDAQPRYAAFGLMVLGGGLFLTLALVAGLLLLFAHAAPRPGPEERAPPAPRLEVAAGEDLSRVSKRAARRLVGYGWADRTAGVAHIPIDRAMQLTVERGWSAPDRAP